MKRASKRLALLLVLAWMPAFTTGCILTDLLGGLGGAGGLGGLLGGQNVAGAAAAPAGPLAPAGGQINNPVAGALPPAAGAPPVR